MDEEDNKPARSRVRKPDPETATEESITTTEEVAEALGLQADTLYAEPLTTQGEQPVAPTPLEGPFHRQGFNIVDAKGRRIAMAGIPGDTVRTGPGLAEALVALLNR